VNLRVVPERSIVKVEARAPLHSTHAEGRALTGSVEIDAEDPVATLKIDVTAEIPTIKSGDFLLDSKSHSHVEASRYPKARFVLAHATGTAAALRLVGTITWRGRDVPITATGRAEIGTTEARGSARFELDMRSFGLTAPKLLFLKVQDVVKIDVEIVAIQG
jgi:polyisoprenoid-binding protein YceI